MSSKSRFYIERILAWIAAIILVQTLFFKFSGAQESVELFSQLGVEPYGRIGLGVVELISAILLFIPRTAVYGAILTLGLMLGAVISHLAILGIAGEMGSLFALALVTLFCALGVMYFRQKELLQLKTRLLGK